MDMIYGVDTTKKVTLVMVRDAVVLCFYDAHCVQSGLVDGDIEMTKNYCQQIVKKAFTETRGDFDKPTKTSLLASLSWLADFSKSFRDQSVIQKHMGEIQKLMVLVED